MEHFFAPCPRGLEVALAQELVELGAMGVRAAEGGAHFSGRFPLCYQVNLYNRIASRVLWRVGHSGYRNEEDIYQAAYGLAWPDFFDIAATIKVSVNATKAPLRSLDFVTLRIKDAVCDRFRGEAGARPSVDTRDPTVRIHGFLAADEVTFYLDTSGEPLFKRGWREQSGEAPLRENLAAGILRLAGWRPEIVLLDPMCGSGTLLVEAAQMALGIAPGTNRRFGFERLANFDNAAWQALIEEQHQPRPVRNPPAIFGSDVDEVMLAAAKKNLSAAGVMDAVRLKRGDVLELSPPATEGVIVTNPPYGVRQGEQARLERFYPRLGDALKQAFVGWTAYIFTADLRLPKLIGLSASRRTPLYNGPLECRLFEYRLVAGTMRTKKMDSQR
jgi:23S rRNA (guanine2445-N2)-methyltransferase